MKISIFRERRTGGDKTLNPRGLKSSMSQRRFEEFGTRRREGTKRLRIQNVGGARFRRCYVWRYVP